ncbi:MAG: diguanylate cyclase [Gammaproteobacteria bacterium]|nr:diguanylate cyclase [Gammaproteobacteria bacterium]
MSSITKLRTSQTVKFFDNAVALNLVQAFHRHLDIEALLELFYSQATATLQLVGMRFKDPDGVYSFEFGESGPHTTSYNLTYQETKLGEIVFHFPRRASEDTLATAEDLAALVMSPINNALIYARARHTPPKQPKLTDASRSQVPPIAPGNDDSLVLLGLDGFTEIQDRDGPEWAQTLVSSMQSQISEGLREADSVYQIDGGLLAVLLPKTSVARAIEVSKKVRVLVAGLHLKDGAVATQLTACMGIAGTKHASTAEQVFSKAKDALLLAKAEGTNSIKCA